MWITKRNLSIRTGGILILFFFYTLMPFGLLGVNASDLDPFALIPTEDLLKTSVENIINERLIEECSLKDLETNECLETEIVTQYIYQDEIISEQIRYIDEEIVREDIDLRTFNSLSFPLYNNKEYIEKFLKPNYVKDDDVWKILKYATTTIEYYSEQVNPTTPLSFLSDFLFFKPVLAEDVSIDGDAHTDSNHTGSNYETTVFLTVAYRPSLWNKYSFLQADLSSYYGDTVTDSKFNFYISSFSEWTTKDVYYSLPSSSWAESTITYTNQPSTGVAFETIEYADTDTGWEAINIQTEMENWLDESISNYGIAIKPELDGNSSWNEDMALHSSEYTTDTDLRPYFSFTISGSETPATTTTASTTTGSVPNFNDLSIISGYAEEYTDSTTTPSKVIYYVFHIPFIVWLVIWLVSSFIFGRIILEIIIRLRK
jgi:hypothetical protein